MTNIKRFTAERINCSGLKRSLLVQQVLAITGLDVEGSPIPNFASLLNFNLIYHH